jgi:pilus assembly protein CpaE
MSARGSSFQSSDKDAVMNGEFMAFVMDTGDASSVIIRRWAERQGFSAATVQAGGPDMFAQMLESAPPPKMVIVDVDGQQDPASIAERLINLCGSDSKLIVVGSENDVSLYRAMLKVGVTDYLVKPLADESLNQALAAVLRGSSAGKNETKDARIIVVIGTRGGVGASTIAVNTGWLLAHEMKASCALLDLDLQFGTGSLALDLEPGRGLHDIVSAPDRVDSLMIASSLVPESDQFSILSAEEAVDEFVQVDSGAISALLKEMKGNFDHIIIDLPRHVLAAQKRLLATAHEIIIVTELSLAGIRDTLRIKTALTNLGCSGTITYIASRVSSVREGQIDIVSFEKGAQVKIDLVFPEDMKTVAMAANSGKALGAVARQAATTKVLRTLTHRLTGKTENKAKKDQNFLKKILNRNKLTTKNRPKK